MRSFTFPGRGFPSFLQAFRSTLAISLLASAITAASPMPAFAGAMIWTLNPVTGRIDRVEASTGRLLGSFAVTCDFVPFPCVPPDPARRVGGLAIADGGKTLLYQAFVEDPLGIEATVLFQLDPFDGVMIRPPMEMHHFWIDLGLGWSEPDLLFYAHAVPRIGDIHRLENARSPAAHDIEFWGPFGPSAFSFVGGIGGDGGSRQFGLYRAEQDVGCTAALPNATSGLFIGEFDPFLDTNQFLRCYPAPANDTVGLAVVGDVLFASTASGKLYSLNANTGAVIRVVSLPDTNGVPYESDIAASLPEPSLLVLFGVGGAAAFWRRAGRRRHAE
jgi:hypothetical protein